MLGGVGPVAEVEDELTRLHAEAVEQLPARGIRRLRSTSIGFHGHTILHRPAERRTWQIGDGAVLARPARAGCRRRFPLAPMSPPAGEGAPLAPLFHAALGRRAAKAARGAQHRRRRECDLDRRRMGSILAFDTGPGNALDRRLGAPAYRRRSRFRRRAGPRRHASRKRMSRGFSDIRYFDRRAAEIARPRRFPGRDAARALARGRRGHLDRDDRGGGRRGDPAFPRAGRASGW